VSITFNPSTAGAKSALLSILSDVADVDVTLSGTGTDQEITVSPLSLDFGDQDIDAGATLSQTVVITNAGTAPLHITSVSIAGPDSTDFAIVSGGGAVTLTPGQTRTVRVTFDPSSTGSKSADLQIVSDDTSEPTVDVALSGTGTETEPTIGFTSATQSAAEDAGSLAVTAQLSKVYSQLVTLPFSVSGTATPGGLNDYTITASPIVIPAGKLTATVVITVVNDSLDEPDETVVVTLGLPTNAVLGATTVHTVTLLDDDVAPSPDITVSPPALDFGSQDIDAGPTLSQTVTISNSGSITLNLSSVTITGPAASHFIKVADSGEPVLTPGQARTVSVSFNPSSTGAKSAALQIVSDLANVNVDLNGTGIDQEIVVTPLALNFGSQEISAGASLSQTVTITNVGSADLNLTSVTLVGLEAGHFAKTFDSGQTTLSPGASRTVKLRFDPGSTGPKAATLQIVSNDTDENPVNVALSGTGVETQPVIVFNTAAQSVSEAAGVLTLTVILNKTYSQAVTVPFSAGGSATPGAANDYTLTASPVVIPAGSLTATIVITLSDDSLDEPDETVVVTLGVPANATLGATRVHTTTILDNDPPPVLTISDATIVEGDVGSKTAVFTVTLSGPSSQIVTVNYTTANGSATAPGDYTATSGSLTFPAGTVARTIAVTVNSDILAEPDEDFLVNLSGANNATLGDGQGRGVILTDDTAHQPALSISLTGPASAAIGEVVTFTYRVEHSLTSDNTPVSQIEVGDSAAGTGLYLSGDTNGNNQLEAGEVWLFAASYTPKPIDYNPLLHAVTVTGRDQDHDPVVAATIHSLALRGYEPVLYVDIDGPMSAQAGDTVTFNVMVVNLNPVSIAAFALDTLSIASIGDGSPIHSLTLNPNRGSISYVTGDLNTNNQLDRREAWLYRVTYRIAASDPNPMTLTLSAQGQDQEGDLVSAQDSHRLSFTPASTQQVFLPLLVR
jgi:hypothetical protein